LPTQAHSTHGGSDEHHKNAGPRPESSRDCSPRRAEHQPAVRSLRLRGQRTTVRKWVGRAGRPRAGRSVQSPTWQPRANAGRAVRAHRAAAPAALDGRRDRPRPGPQCATVARYLRRLGLARLRNLAPRPRRAVRVPPARGLVHLDIRSWDESARRHRITGDRRSRVRASAGSSLHVAVDMPLGWPMSSPAR